MSVKTPGVQIDGKSTFREYIIQVSESLIKKDNSQ